MLMSSTNQSLLSSFAQLVGSLHMIHMPAICCSVLVVPNVPVSSNHCPPGGFIFVALAPAKKYS